MVHRWVGALVGLALLGMAGAANATLFNFDITFDGISATDDMTSDTIVGASLAPGDVFNLDVHALGKDFWTVNTTTNEFVSVTFVVNSGTRIADITTTLFLDGVQVDQVIENGTSQANVHIGTQSFLWIAGTVFDQVVVDWSFLSQPVGVSTIIADRPQVLGFSPFFDQSYVTYTVPEPSTLAIFLVGLAGLGFVTRRRRTGVGKSKHAS